MKKIVTLMLVFALFVLMNTSVIYAINASANNTQTSLLSESKIVLSAQDNAILTDVNQPIDLRDYEYKHNQNTTVSINDVTLTSFSESLTINDLVVTVSTKGAHAFLLQYQSANIYVYVIAKDSADTEYILYEEDFSGMQNGKLPSGYSIVTGSAGITNEQLLVAGKGGSAIVTLPNYLRSFMNYVIETDFTIVDQDNNSRWASVMFRYSTENYYQMAIRKEANAANGIEFAKRIAGAWNVTNTAAFHESISPNNMYNLKIDVLDATVKEYINDELYITHEQALEYKKGLVGVQASGANALFDNFKITLPVDYVRTESFEFTQIPNVYQPVTGIVNPATVVTRIESFEQLTSYKNNKRPATGIISVNGNLEVVSSTNQVLATLYETLIQMNGQIIPAIDPTDVSTAKLIAEKLKLWGIIDCFFISSDTNLIKEARSVNPIIRGILDYSSNNDELTENKLNEIRDLVNTSECNAVILNESLINKKAINYLQHRLITCWTTSSQDTQVNHYKAILSGVNGIVTDYYSEIYDIYSSVTEITHVREVFIIAHRGLHNGYTNSAGPENTIDVSKKAVENGAKILEIDVHLTIDDDVVVIHDNSTLRTAGVNFNVSEQYLGFLETIPLLDVSNTNKEYRISSYRAFLEAFKDDDVVLFVEIKPNNYRLLERVKEITEELEMQNDIVFIMFAAENAQNLSTVMPNISKGYLTGSVITANTNQSLLSVLTSVVPMKTTINPSYAPVTSELVSALTHRGITIWPWTVDDVSSMNYLYNSGVGGITTNMMDHYFDTFIHLNYENTQYTINQNDTNFRVEGFIQTQGFTKYAYRSNLNIIHNTANASFDQTGKVTSIQSQGEIVFYTKVDSSLPNGISIVILSDLMTINVQGDSIWDNPFIYIGLGLTLACVITVPLVIYMKNKKRRSK